MAHFAELDADGKVLQVIVVNNDDCLDETGDESEAVGIAFCQANFGGGWWVQTSYNHNFRHRYADVDGFYDAELDIFIPPKPFTKWVLNKNFVWIPPVPYPEVEGIDYAWNDEDGEWVAL